MGVGAALCSLLINACENQLGYSKPLVLLHDGVSVNATCAVGVNGSAPASAPDQPFLLPGTRYCFDSKFRGVDGFGPLCIALADSCTDCSLYIDQNGKTSARSNNLRYCLRCTCYKVQKQNSENFLEGHYVMKNTIPMRNKAHRTKGQKTIVDRFATHKMKSKSADNTSHPQFRVGDEILQEDLLRRTSTQRAKNKETRCHMKIELLMNPHSQRWFLSNKSSLSHQHHYELPPKADKFDSADLNDDETSWMKQMYNMGLSNGTIAGVLNGFLHDKGKKGSFSPASISNMTSKYGKELDLLSDVSPDMTQAEKTMALLNK
jgi:hypothetical protein